MSEAMLLGLTVAMVIAVTVIVANECIKALQRWNRRRKAIA
jgi:hypothetical protein